MRDTNVMHFSSHFFFPILLFERHVTTLFLLSHHVSSGTKRHHVTTLFLLSHHNARLRHERTTTRTSSSTIIRNNRKRRRRDAAKKERTLTLSSSTDRGALVAVLRAVVGAKRPGRRRRMSGRCRRQRLPDRMRREHERDLGKLRSGHHRRRDEETRETVREKPNGERNTRAETISDVRIDRDDARGDVSGENVLSETIGARETRGQGETGKRRNDDDFWKCRCRRRRRVERVVQKWRAHVYTR